jgi:hypothetical protein
MLNFQALIEKQAELTDEIELLGALDKKKAKAIVKRLQVELTEIEGTIAKNQKAIDLQKIASNSALETFGNKFAGIMRSEGIDYNVRCYFDYSFSTGQVTSTLKPATIRGSRDSVIEYSCEPMPTKVTVNLSDNKHETREFTLTASLQRGETFSSWESLYQSFLACYVDDNGNSLQAETALYNSDFTSRTGKKSRFESASAKTGKLQRLTQNKVDLVKFATVIPTGENGSATEAASAAIG